MRLLLKTLSGFLLVALVPALSAWETGKEPPALPMKSFVLPEGLEIVPWALSPALFNPTNMDFDHLGRAWVCEGVNYRKVADRQADDKVRFVFRPADVCVGPDGALYVAVWTDPSVGGHDTQDPVATGVPHGMLPLSAKS